MEELELRIQNFIETATFDKLIKTLADIAIDSKEEIETIFQNQNKKYRTILTREEIELCMTWANFAHLLFTKYINEMSQKEQANKNEEKQSNN